LHGGWNLGWQFRTQTQVVFDGMVASPKKKKFKSQLEKLWLQNFCYEKDVILKSLLPGGGCSELWLLYWNNNKSECSPLSSLSHKKIVWSVISPWQW
jgi:hypothetical protein